MGVLKRQCTLILFVLALFACSNPTIPSLADDAIILAFGDSLTYGVGAKPSNAYPQHLQRLTGRKVINAGISGETTTGGLVRFEQVIDEHQPDLIILMEGGNDILRNHSLEKTKQNLRAMIKIAQSREIPIVLIGVPEKKLFSSSAPLYQELADEFNLVFESSLLSDLLKKSEFKSDPIHLNDKGYEVFAERLNERLKASGAL